MHSVTDIVCVTVFDTEMLTLQSTASRLCQVAHTRLTMPRHNVFMAVGNSTQQLFEVTQQNEEIFQESPGSIHH